MNVLSVKTLGHFIHAAAQGLRKSELRNLLMRSGLYDGAISKLDPLQLSLTEPNANDLLQIPLLAAHEEARSGSKEAHEALLEIVRLGAGQVAARDRDGSARLSALREALISDGYEMRWSSNLLPDATPECRLVPIDPDAIPVSTEITALEAELDSRGYTVAREHYRLAVKHFTEQVPTSSNAELRNMLESLIINLAVDHASYVDTGQANQGGKAIKSLYVIGGKPPAEIGKPLPEDDGGRMLQGIWNIQHPRGSHAGLSDADEARVRMQLNTALARFLLKHFPAKP